MNKGRASHHIDCDDHEQALTSSYSSRKISGYLIGMLFIGLLFSGCFYDEGPPESDSSGEEVSFALDIQPIFNNYCTSCHPGVVEAPDLSEGSSFSSISEGNYVVPNSVEESILFQRLIGNPSLMPPNGSLPASDINLIRNWIEQGALNN